MAAALVLTFSRAGPHIQPRWSSHSAALVLTFSRAGPHIQPRWSPHFSRAGPRILAAQLSTTTFNCAGSYISVGFWPLALMVAAMAMTLPVPELRYLEPAAVFP